MPPEPGTSLRDWPILTSAIVCILIASRVVKFLNGNKVGFLRILHHILSLIYRKLFKGIPRSWVAFSPIMPPGAAIPTCWWNPSIAWVWEWRLSCTYPYNKTLSIMSIMSQFIKSGLRKSSHLSRFYLVPRSSIRPLWKSRDR
jgi:hypothetical protein